MIKVQNFIGGEFLNANENKWIDAKCPLTGEVKTQVPDSGLLDLVRAVQAANQAWSTYRKTEVTRGQQGCLGIAEKIETAVEKLARLQSEETGLSIQASRSSVKDAARSFRFFAEASKKTFTQLDSEWGQNRLPVGLVGIILPAPWPLLTLGLRLAPALAAGNVVIVKSSSQTPQTLNAFAELVRDSGLKPGVFNLLQGRGEQVGQAMVEHPGISTLAFAGRTETGRIINAMTSESLKRVQLSLSSSNPVLIFDGVDLESISHEVARITLTSDIPIHLRGARIFVQESVYKKFLEVFSSAATAISPGSPLDEKSKLGPLSSQREMSSYNLSIEQAIREKGKLLVGGSGFPEGLEKQFSKGYFVKPTVIYDVSLCSTLQQEEVEGPLAMVESFKYQHDAIKHANNSPFGQVAYIFHGDLEKANQVASRIEAGAVFINQTKSLNEVPVTPLKASGLGLFGGEASLRFFSRQALIPMPKQT